MLQLLHSQLVTDIRVGGKLMCATIFDFYEKHREETAR